MLCAAVDTSGNSILTAVADGDGRVLSAGAHEHTAENASRLSGLFTECLDNADLELRDLTHLGVGIGPGSFIGTRTGVAFVNGLATSLSLQVIGLNSLQTAAAAMIREVPNVVVVRNGRRNAYFVGKYKQDSAGISAVSIEPEHEIYKREISGLLECIAGIADGDGVLVVTDSADVFNELESANLPARVDYILRENVVDIRGMALLAVQKVSAGNAKPWVDVTYLRSAVL